MLGILPMSLVFFFASFKTGILDQKTEVFSNWESEVYLVALFSKIDSKAHRLDVHITVLDDLISNMTWLHK